MDFYTADNHFRHANILNYCSGRKKKYGDINRHDSGSINDWNSVVSKDDETTICGDFAFADIPTIKSILSKLNGKKHLIVGNHDKHSWDKYVEAGFSSVQRYKVINVRGFGPVALAHDPSASICMPDIPWFVGHLHQQFVRMGNCINVGVDVRDYKPISIDNLMEDLRITLMHMKIDPNAKSEILGIEK